MEIIAISAVVGAVAFGLGIACGKSSPCNHDIYGVYPKTSEWEVKLAKLEMEQSRLDHLYRSITRDRRYFSDYMAVHHEVCGKTFYAKTVKDADVQEMLRSLDNHSKLVELAKKLDIEVF